MAVASSACDSSAGTTINAASANANTAAGPETPTSATPRGKRLVATAALHGNPPEALRGE